MNVTFTCPRCSQDVRTDVSAAALEGRSALLDCPACHEQLPVPPAAFESGTLTRCLFCPSTDLFVRKDFPQRLGVTLVILGFFASSVAWYYSWPLVTYAILFGTALIDVVLYAVVPNALMCYRCHAQYRGVTGQERHGGFDLETHERHRQQVARLAGPRRQ